MMLNCKMLYTQSFYFYDSLGSIDIIQLKAFMIDRNVSIDIIDFLELIKENVLYCKPVISANFR